MHPLRPLRSRASSLVLATASAVLLPASALAADPVLRHQEELHGDVVVFGSTLGFDCGAGLPAPSGSTASCGGQLNVADGAPDLWWRDDIADASITAAQARTSATLSLPAGSTVTYARLYWAALKVGAAPDTDATLDWLFGPQQSIFADATWVVPYPFASHPDWYYYQASGDATDFVAQWGAGDFRVSDIEGIDLVGQDVDRVFSAWTLVVFYDNPADDLRNLALFDSFTPLDPGVPGQESADVLLTGFLVPQGFTARMSAFAYEGDPIYSGDHFTLNGAQIANAQNPADNFFNSSRSRDGLPVSGTWDVPKLTGAPASMAGYDLDTADVTGLLAAGDTSCVVGADSTLDIFFLGGFVTSVASLSPDFHGMTKDVVDLDGGALLPGDTIEYTISAKNVGNDAAADAVITDVLDSGIALVPGSIEIVQGGAVGAKTNAAGDDEGDYAAGSRTVTWRVGSGAGAVFGGTVPVGGTVVVRFRATVTVDSGIITNQAILTAAGEAGAPEKSWYSDADPLTLGDQPTIIVVYECDTDAECSGQTPHCDPVTHTCVGCSSDADCPDPLAPACQPSGACGECSGTNDTRCDGETPVCDTGLGICVSCTLGPAGNADLCQDDPAGPLCVAGSGISVHCGCVADSDCGDPTSGRVCDSLESVCIDGCRGMGGNGCPTILVCTSPDTTIGQCVPPAAEINEEGSCGCVVPGSSSRDGGVALLAALFGLGAFARRRRRPRP